MNKTGKFSCSNWKRENKHSNKYIHVSDAAKGYKVKLKQIKKLGYDVWEYGGVGRGHQKRLL